MKPSTKRMVAVLRCSDSTAIQTRIDQNPIGQTSKLNMLQWFIKWHKIKQSVR